MSYGYDIKSEKWLSIWKLNPLGDPDYYEKLFKYFRSLCHSMNQQGLVEVMEEKIKTTVEERMGTELSMVLYVYKNLPALNSMTRSKSPTYHQEYVYKSEIKRWLDDIEEWIFDELVGFETSIRFRESQRIM